MSLAAQRARRRRGMLFVPSRDNGFIGGLAFFSRRIRKRIAPLVLPAYGIRLILMHRSFVGRCFQGIRAGAMRPKRPARPVYGRTRNVNSASWSVMFIRVTRHHARWPSGLGPNWNPGRQCAARNAYYIAIRIYYDLRTRHFKDFIQKQVLLLRTGHWSAIIAFSRGFSCDEQTGSPLKEDGCLFPR